jgi:hypothetical protein
VARVAVREPGLTCDEHAVAEEDGERFQPEVAAAIRRAEGS